MFNASYTEGLGQVINENLKNVFENGNHVINTSDDIEKVDADYIFQHVIGVPTAVTTTISSCTVKTTVNNLDLNKQFR